MPKLYTLGFSSCTEQFLRKYYGFKMQGKWDTLRYIPHTKKIKNLNRVILYNIWKVFHCWLFFVERQWSENYPKKKYLTFCWTLRYEKIWSKEPLQCMYDFIKIHRSSLRALETKPVSFYMILNLSYETKVGGVAEFLKAHVKNYNFFYGILCKHAEKKYIISYKTSVG